MPSPFPGMDPYLESAAFWRDFLGGFIIYCRDMLNELLPNQYDARCQKHLPEMLDGNGTPYIEVYKRPERTLIAAIELLTPWNKNPPDRQSYLQKRNALLRQPIHLVELDLLLGGHRLPMRQALPRGDYYAFVSREGERTHSEVYAWAMDQPLPTIRVPLKAPDADVLLNLQALFTATYDRSRYANALRYQGPPPMALPEQVLRWIDGALQPLRTPPA